MTSTWRRTLSYLGLAPDEEYEDYDRYDDPTMAPSMATQQVTQMGAPVTGNGSHGVGGVDAEPSGRVSSVRPVSVVEEDSSGDLVVGGANGANGVGAERQGKSRSGNVRSINTAPAQVKPVVLSPAAFGDAKTVGDHFKNERPVIMNLQGADRDLRRRLIDFASGICYGLGGQMTRVAKEIFLLTPADVEVSEEDQRKLAEHGLYEV